MHSLRQHLSIIFLFLCFCLALFTPQKMHAESDSSLVFPDFDISLMRYGYSKPIYNQLFKFKNRSKRLLELRKNMDDFRKSYNQNIIKFTADKKAPLRIPKVIHQIWLGGNIPDSFKNWMKSWINMEGWEYKLWTDEEVGKLTLYNQTLFDNSKCFGKKADILRYEILFNEGGVYVDTDFECLNPNLFDQLNRSFDFYAGFEPIDHHHIATPCPILGNAILASVPGHPILEKLVLEIKEHSQTHKTSSAIISTGPGFLTNVILKYKYFCESQYVNIFLPPTFLYPITYAEARLSHQSSFDLLVRPETAAIHYWSGTWLD